MTDKELLEYAAKAAGVYIEEWYDSAGAYYVNQDGSRWWNPLTDDGDALRLAVKLCLCVDCVIGADEVTAFVADGIFHSEIDICADDRHAATRRAIVRAAAEIGRAMT